MSISEAFCCETFMQFVLPTLSSSSATPFANVDHNQGVAMCKGGGQGRSHVAPWGGRGPCKKKKKKSTGLYRNFNWPRQ